MIGGQSTGIFSNTFFSASVPPVAASMSSALPLKIVCGPRMAAFAVVILAIVAMGGTVFMQVNALEKARMDRVRASAVQREAESAKFYLARQESSYRGFLLSRDPYYLERLSAHGENFGKSLDRITQLDRTSEDEVRAARAAAAEWTRNVVETDPRSASQSVSCQRTASFGLTVEPISPP